MWNGVRIIMWIHHLWNLLDRSWGTMTSAYGTTTLGFLVGTFLLNAISWVAPVAVKWYELRRKTAQPVHQALQEFLPTGRLLAKLLAAVAFISYAASFVYTTYQDHQSLVKYGIIVASEDTALSRELEIRKHSMVRAEPVFTNTEALLTAFATYRHAQNGKPCVIMLTAPLTDNSPMISMVSGLSNPVSDCSTIGPMNSDLDPDVEKRAMNGMVPNKIVFHAERENMAANRLFNSLDGLIPLQRSYDMPSTADRKQLYVIPRQGQEDLIWLQFGTNVNWSEQLRR